MFSLKNNFVNRITLDEDNVIKNKYEDKLLSKDKVVFLAFSNVSKNSFKVMDLRTVNALMATYNLLSFLKTYSYNDVLMKTNKVIIKKNLIYGDFIYYIQAKNWNLKNDFELINDRVGYKFSLDMKYKYGFTLYSKHTIIKSLFYGYLNYIFIIGEESYNFDQDSGYHQNYSISDFLGNLYDFLMRYIDNVISKSKNLLKSDSLGDILLSIHELVYTYLEEKNKIGLSFFYPINLDSIASYDEEDYNEDYDEDDYGEDEYTSIDCYVNSDLNFVLERGVNDFIFYYGSDVYVTVYKDDIDSYDGSPIGFSLNVAKHQHILKIRLVISLYLDLTYNEFYIEEPSKKSNKKKTKKITAKSREERINKHDILYYEEIDLSNISNKKYINIINEINNHIDNILDGKILIGVNDNIVL